jgi:peptidyl-prolyl cis-trans isomerase SurA
MKNFKILIILIVCSFFQVVTANTLENRILFKVNNEIITSLDIFNELRYLEIINKQFRNTEKKQAFEIAKRSLIREKIKEIELKKKFNEIKVDKQLLNNILINTFKELKIKSISDLEKYFASIDIDNNLIRKKIAIEIMWNQLIYDKYNQKVKINKKEIINLIKGNNKQKEIFISEILFNVNENENVNDKFILIKNKIAETNFAEAALVYSISNTYNKGGELGWIKETSLSQKIKNILQKINLGEYSNPIVVPGGFLILKIEDRREVDNDINLDDAVRKIINEKTNEQLNQYSNLFFNKAKKNIVINEL